LAEFKSIKKSFDGRVVLNDFSLNLKKGSKTAIMGESGSGKTTLLRIAAGLERADEGLFEHNGKLAVMFQEPRLLPWKNAKQNIEAVLKKENHRLAEEYLKTVGLSDAAEKYPHELSGGMAQRVAFARFLAYAEESCADLLLLDEPFSALDKETADKMVSVLRQASHDKTVVLVTHDQAQAKAFADRIVNF